VPRRGRREQAVSVGEIVRYNPVLRNVLRNVLQNVLQTRNVLQTQNHIVFFLA